MSILTALPLLKEPEINRHACSLDEPFELCPGICLSVRTLEVLSTLNRTFDQLEEQTVTALQ
ncbi:MAG: hypothetical protein CMJ46_13875 [Planctomyces sp.]|nr:hypothetical protein [Planctomyces sp.]